MKKQILIIIWVGIQKILYQDILSNILYHIINQQVTQNLLFWNRSVVLISDIRTKTNNQHHFNSVNTGEL
jgi:hypothetical protein